MNYRDYLQKAIYNVIDPLVKGAMVLLMAMPEWFEGLCR